MQWQYSVNAAFLGGRRDRFNRYQPDRSLDEKFALAGQIDGVTGIELKYPADLSDVEQVKVLLDKHQLVLSAVNVNLKAIEHFHDGALSAPDAEARQRALRMLREGMDIAAEMGAELVSTCPLAEGYDYPFQVDYTTTWANFIDTVKTAVQYRDDIKLVLEYQPHEPHAKILLNNVGKMLHVIAEVGAPNFGANLDVGHSFAAGEAPAEAAALLASKGSLLYLHSNDNTGDGGDWDMISGTVHFWHWLELLYTLRKVDYQGWIGADVASKHHDPVKAFRTNLLMIERLSALLERIGMDTIAEMQARRADPATLFDLFSDALIP